VLSTGAGVLTRKDMEEHQKRLAKDKDFDPRYSQLLDFLQVTDIEITPEDVRALATANLFSGTSRRAFLVKDSLSFGLARVFQTHRELKGESGIRVFRKLDEAVDWLLAAKPA
jgi:hypothetical protein